MVKNVKKKLVTLFACAAVFSVGGAIAIGNATTANAAVEVDWTDPVISEERGFYTQDGASIRLISGNDYGIRWAAIVSSDFDAALRSQFEGKIINYGSLIAPASYGELTVDTENVANEYWSVQPNFAESGETTYEYAAAVRYSNLSDEQKTEAFAVELQARMYVEIKESESDPAPIYYYAEQGDVVRSMRSVAISASYYSTDPNLVSGVAQYVGGGFQSTTVNTEINGFVEYSANVSGEVTAENLTAGTTYEVYVGGMQLGSVTAENDGTATVDVTKMPSKINGEEVVAGEAYDMLFIDVDGNVVAQPFRAVTKIIKETSDFEIFKITEATISGTVNSSYKVDSATTFDGYYVLGNDIIWDDTVHNADAELRTGAASLRLANAGGLTGTFDGNGYTITGMKVQGGGLFGIVDGGTIKNVAFKDVQISHNTTVKPYGSTTNAGVENFGYYKAGLAYQLSNATLQNVYMQCNTMTSDRGRALVAGSILSDTKMENCIFKLDSMGVLTGSQPYNISYGSLCGIEVESIGKTSVNKTWNNVYVISPVELSVWRSNGWQANAVIDSANQIPTSWEYSSVGGTLYGFSTEDPAQLRDESVFTFVTLNGITRYDTATDMVAANNDYSGFDGDYWQTKDGFIPVFKGESFVKYVAEELTYEQDAQTIDLTALNLADGEEIISVAFADGSHTASYDNATQKLTVNDFTADGNVYGLEFTTDAKTIYHANVKTVSKIIRNVADFEMFTISEATIASGKVTSATKFDGYYMLGNDIAWNESSYTHNADAQNKLSTGKIDVDHTGGGLTGTFDGNGYAITGMKIQNGGLFGLVCGGTIKNVAFKDVAISGVRSNEGALYLGRSKAGLAYALSGATLENVYMNAATLANDSGNRALVATVISNQTKMKSCIFVLGDADVQVGATEGTTVNNNYNFSYGSLCSVELSSEPTKRWNDNPSGGTYVKEWSNVYVISPIEIAVYSSNGYNVYSAVDAFNHQSDAINDLYGYAGTGITPNTTQTAITPVADKQSDGTRGVCQGITRYDTAADMVGNFDVTKFDSTYWTLGEDGTPVFKTKVVESKEEGVYEAVTGGYALVEYIGDSENAIIPDTYQGEPVVSVRYSAFQNNRNIKNIVLPDSIQSIDAEAFANCVSLESIYVGNVESIGYNGFYNCYTLKTVTFGACATITDLPQGIFYNCYALNEITLPQSLVYIGENAFYNCNSLLELTVPSEVYQINDAAFAECNKLIRVRNLSEATLPASLNGEVLTGETTAFASVITKNDDGIILLVKDGIEYVLGYEGENSQLSLEGISATHVFDYAFVNNNRVSKIIFGDSVANIGANAFANCSNLIEVEFSAASNLAVIGDYAFSGCDQLANVYVPAEVSTIGEYAFYGCNKLVLIRNFSGVELNGVPENDLQEVKTDDSAFVGALTVTEEGYITLSVGDRTYLMGYNGTSETLDLRGTGVTDIYAYAFDGKVALKSIKLGDVRSIGEFAFRGCSALHSIVIPQSVTRLGEFAFADCVSLETLTFEEGSSLEGVPAGAFYGCSALKSVLIPRSVKSLGDRAFYNCAQLKSVTFENNSALESVGNYAFYCAGKLESVVIPKNVATVGNYAFYNCSKMKELSFANGALINYIGKYAFYECISLTKLDFIRCNSLSIVDEYAFSRCSGITQLILNGTVNYVYLDAFKGCSAITDFYFGGSAEEYKELFDFDLDNDEFYGDNRVITSVSVNKYYYSETQPTDDEYSYWCYMNGKIMYWNKGE